MQQIDSTSTLNVPFVDSGLQVEVEKQNLPKIEDSTNNAAYESTVVKVAPVVKPTAAPAAKVTTPISFFNADLLAPVDEVEALGVNSFSPADTTQVALQLPPPLMRKKVSTVWEIPLLLICLLVIALAKAFNQRRFNLLSKSVFNIRVVPQYLREENAFSNQVISVLSLAFILITSLLILQIVRLWMPELALKPFKLYSQLCFFIVLVYITKFSVLELLSEVFDKTSIVREYIFNVLLFNCLIAICLIPIVLTNSILLSNQSLFNTLGIGVIALIFLLRNWRAFSLGRMHKYPVYYIFLYLCTLEILPAIVLVKLLKQQLN